MFRLTRLKALLIIYLILFSHRLKMSSSKPKHVAMFSEIVYIRVIKSYRTKIKLLLTTCCAVFLIVRSR